MNRMAVEIVFAAGVTVAVLAGTANAENSAGIAALDKSLRGAVERKDVPGMVALITDRQRFIKAHSAWQTWRPSARSRPTPYFESPR